jgi:hypothetical protein
MSGHSYQTHRSTFSKTNGQQVPLSWIASCGVTIVNPPYKSDSSLGDVTFTGLGRSFGLPWKFRTRNTVPVYCHLLFLVKKNPAKFFAAASERLCP